MSKAITGGCQCGAVRYRVDVELSNPHLCHCRMCQKAAGNYFMSLASAPREKIVITRGNPAWFHSSDIVRRGFCPGCGTPLFFDPVNTGEMLVTLRSLDDPSCYTPTSEDSVESRVHFLPHLSGLHQKVTEDDFGPDEIRAISESNHQHPDHDTDRWPGEDKQ